MLILPLAVAVAVSGACVPLAIMQWHCHTTRTQQVDVILPTCGLNGTATLSFSPSATFIRLLAGTNRTSVVSLAVDAGHGLDPALLGPCLAPLVLVANTSCILSCLYVAGNSVASGCEWDVLPLGTLFQVHPFILSRRARFTAPRKSPAVREPPTSWYPRRLLLAPVS
eukprot:TRINITY_DN5789_c0_g1_i4.p1 TRINITY_DN5789_c0_g1~~TRINITY_DN5789_c0_g1_i4.p1  ORF type:complete len:168 (-),score=6.94 TRINITY_DN5789_c0_g1_i4:269-772(-)